MNGGSSRVVDIYRDKYVAFIDLLGFKDLVSDAEKHPENRNAILNILQLFRDTLCRNPSIGLHLTQFSDCLIISADRTPGALFEILASCETLTSNLLQFDVLVRGGLAVGGAHHDETFVYGAAVNAAYLLERCADHPMILLADDVLADVRANGPEFEKWLEYDKEGPAPRAFVHYLRRYAEYNPDDHSPGTVLLEDPATRIVDFVCNRLNTHTDRRVLEKARWLQSYWNRTVAALGIFGRIETGVTGRITTSGPTIIFRRLYVPS